MDRSSHIRDDVVIVTGNDNDQVVIGEFPYGEPPVGLLQNGGFDIEDDLIVNTGDGTDLIDVAYYDVGGNVTLDAGPGDDLGGGFDQSGLAPSYSGGVLMYDMDIAGNLHVFLGSGDDAAEIEYISVGGNALIDAGTGDDGRPAMMPNGSNGYGFGGVGIYGLTVDQSFWLILGSGYDSADVYDVYVGRNAYFNAGGDDDEVALNYVDVEDNLFVYMGGGDDALFIDGSSADNAWLYGNGGDDLYAEGSNSFGTQREYSFESSIT
jgi:hypothetical protein